MLVSACLTLHANARGTAKSCILCAYRRLLLLGRIQHDSDVAQAAEMGCLEYTKYTLTQIGNASDTLPSTGYIILYRCTV